MIRFFSKTSLIFLIGLMALGLALPQSALAKAQAPNILLIITDDTGIDQYTAFGYGGTADEQAKTPNINALANAGIRFSNAWSHPSCGPTRASIMVGRFTPRFNMLSAPAPPDLPNSQTSPFEYAIPKLLQKKNYLSAIIGKMHQSTDMRDPNNLPFLNETMRHLGADYFEGYLEGGPAPIDTTAGGIGGSNGNGKVYGCGFVPSKADNKDLGSDSGACYTSDPNPTCTLISTATVKTPGLACLEKGGIFVPEATACEATRPANLNYNTQNGHYTGNWVVNLPDGTTTTQKIADSRGRGFKTEQEVTRAIRWINQQGSDRPWMLSLGLSAIHEPVQQSPRRLVPSDAANTAGYTCNDDSQNRELATQMVEAIDHEVGRLLVESRLASWDANGRLVYDAKKSNTYVIFTSDNGTWTTSVRTPFDPTRAKGTPYQTGVSVPLIIAGPSVKAPGRNVDHMVNLADLYAFFGEVANIDVHKAVPKSRPLDAQKMMAYLTNPKQGAIRQTNYTVQGNNLRASSTVSYPCLIEGLKQCTYSLPSKSVCLDQGGKWYGPNGEVKTSPGYYTSCCQVNQATGIDYLSSLTSTGIRNTYYKLVRQVGENCVNGSAVQPPKIFDEFFEVNQNAPNPKLDTASLELLKGNAASLSANQRRNYETLKARLKRLESSFTACPGDGNMDKVVNQKDLDDWAIFASTTPGSSTPNGGGKGSWYDLGGPADHTRPDGLTDETDRQIILQNFGKRCK